ncbi:MAG TPA: hypothetical protein VJ757_03055 [Pseudonocardiaceae bacterium]|nr:hypothetical protein [Pseudonocardiaceae bacterium]
MTDRELRVAIRERFDALRIAVRQRRAELIDETEADLLERCQAESERIEQLSRGLHEITEEANRKAVALLREFEDLAGGGRWKGIREAMFEVPRISRVNSDRSQRHRTLMADIEKQTELALRVLDRQQASLLRAPDRARTLMAKGVPAIVTGLIPPARLSEA